MSLSFGIPVNSSRPSSTDVDRFEMKGPGPKDIVNLPLAMGNVTKGLGTNGAATGEYPRKLDDGYFLSLAAVSGADFGADLTVGGPFRAARDTDFYNYALNANTVPVYLYFGASSGSTSGDENPEFLDYPTNTISNPDYEPGSFYSEAVTGYQGLIDAWVPVRCVQEADLTGYVAGAAVTVSKGRCKLAVSGDKYVGVVERKFSTTKVLIKFNISGSLPTKP
jgi:hypothetical protein